MRDFFKLFILDYGLADHMLAIIKDLSNKYPIQLINKTKINLFFKIFF
ncbi:hypothetical protein OENI_10513 [Oenococcus oeni]|nr:hypothetical protein OENI_10513 [Oenococcus oeni]SYV99325.1 hypothetical protein OENI_150020 [Oenococcus oeni]SYW18151.1 hypothetical protein OENI_20221 [Oenococcus oeni]